MAKKGGTKEGFIHDPSITMPSEQKISESNKQKIAKIHDMFPSARKDHIAKILQYYDDDESRTVDAITRDGGKEALSNLADAGSFKSKNNKNKKKKKKGKKDLTTGTNAAASFDADDSSSIHSSGNVDAELEKDYARTENGNFHELDDEKKSSHERLKNLDEPLLNSSNKEVAVDQDVKNSHGDSSSEASSRMQMPNKASLKDNESTIRGSPVSDISDKLDEQKKEKHRFSKDDGKHLARQRTSSFRRSKTSSLSEESSQYNPQATAAPTKRGYDKCKKDLYRQTASLQRIQLQLEKGLEESGKKLKNSFNEVRKLLDKRLELVELELQKTKEEALNLLKSRKDLAIELNRRVDKTPSLTEAEWSELRSDIKQFVTERKYDDELGKTIWFQWSMDSITDIINSFGEVQPVKNVYSQRSHSALSNAAVLSTNAEPSPSSSLANEDINSTADKNDIGNISDAVEDEIPIAEKETVPAFKSQPTNRSLVYFNTRFSNQRFSNQNRGNRGFNRGNKGFAYPRQNYKSYSYRNNYNNNYDQSSDYRHDRGNDGASYSNERNMNRDTRNDRNQGRVQNSNYRSGAHRFHGNSRQQRHHAAKAEVPANETVECESSNVVNGFVNN